MKKTLSLLLTLVMLLAGCGALAENAGVTLTDPYCGITLTVDAEHANLGLDTQTMLDYETNLLSCAVLSMYEEALAPLEGELSDAINANDEDRLYKVLDEVMKHMPALANVTLIAQEDYDAAIAAGKTAADLVADETAEVLGENAGYTYILSYPAVDLTAEGLSEDEIAQFEAAIAYLPELMKTIEFSEPREFDDEYKMTLPSDALSFTVKDLDGNDVSSDELFAAKDLTVVNFWGTFCGPCIGEMPELGEWVRTMPENVQLVGIVIDIEDADDVATIEDAAKILKDANAAFVNLIPSDGLADVVAGISAVPTTIFVDKDGNIVGEPIVGADVEGYKAFVEEYLKGLE